MSEGSHPRPFECYADAFPKAKYYWQFHEGNRTTAGNTLDFRHAVRREEVGKQENKFKIKEVFGATWSRKVQSEHKKVFNIVIKIQNIKRVNGGLDGKILCLMLMRTAQCTSSSFE